MTLGPARCYACKDPKEEDHYLCRVCWPKLSPETRKALNRRDRKASLRLRELSRAIFRETPLSEIQVTP